LLISIHFALGSNTLPATFLETERDEKAGPKRDIGGAGGDKCTDNTPLTCAVKGLIQRIGSYIQVNAVIGQLLVAQEVEKVIPEAVSANNKGYLLVNNDPILWSMLNAIKGQQQQIRAQQKQLQAQAAELANLKARLEGHLAQPAPR
jgi:hypothetical protein